ncbi:MAG: FAD-binding oxidoreductase [Candidatus Tectimicrobiota bacterium]
MSIPDGLAAALESELGSASLLTGSATAAYAIDGIAPAMVALPTHIEEVAAVLRRAGEQQCTIVPRGGGSHIWLGQTPQQVDLVLSMQRLQQQLAYEPADMTTTVQAGICMLTLQQMLARSGQRVALDPPLTPTTTLGGLVAANRSGPRRLLYGTARDVLLGMTVVTLDGKCTKSGGRVVKNVTGYDVTKLYIGSLGTLAVLAELTVKLHPLPPGEVTIGVECAHGADLLPVLQMLLQLPLRLNSLELLNSTACVAVRMDTDVAMADSAYMVLARMEGLPTVLQSQERRVREALRRMALRRAPAVYTWSPAEQERLWQGVGALLRGERVTQQVAETMLMQVSLRMSDLPAFCQTVEDTARQFACPCAVVAHAGNGIVYVHLPVAAPTASESARLLECLQAIDACVARLGGRRVLERAPVMVKQQCQVWGATGDDFPLMRAIKTAYDPHGRLNPGRFIGGL